MPSTAIQLDAVTKTYGSGDSKVEALRGVSATIETGERVALLGKSGSGKSTLLNILGGLDRPSGGKVIVAGEDLSAMSAKKMARYRLSTVGMIFQSYNLIPSSTAARNVELPLVLAGESPRGRKRTADDALQSVGLADRATHYPSQLSGGEQQRVAIARALMNKPQVLLADEPTGNLDTNTAEEITSLLMNFINESRTTFVLVTHDEDLAERIADRVLRIQDGQFLE